MTAAGTARTHTLVLTGAESSGKTTLAQDLAEHFNAPLVAEYARAYLVRMHAQHGPAYAYTEADVDAIAVGQYAAEQQAMQSRPSMLVLDTDLLVIRLWMQVRYRRVPAWIDVALQPQPGRLYLLTTPEMPWAADPLREHRDQRTELHALYRAALAQRELAFIELAGTPEVRLQRVLLHLQSELSR